MGRTVKQIILLLCVIIHLIGSICSLHCPRYEKHEAIRKGLLNDKAIYKAAKYGLEEEICLNGLQTEGFYCATGSCNVFGYNCDGYCLTGDVNIDVEDDYAGKFDDIIRNEKIQVCNYYRDKFLECIGHEDCSDNRPLLPPGYGGLQDTRYERHIENIKQACAPLGRKLTIIPGNKNKYNFNFH